MSKSDIRSLLNARYAAEAAIVDCLRVHYPPGTMLEYILNGRLRPATVVENSWSDRIKIRNEETKAEKWVRASAIWVKP